MFILIVTQMLLMLYCMKSHASILPSSNQKPAPVDPGQPGLVLFVTAAVSEAARAFKATQAEAEEKGALKVLKTAEEVCQHRSVAKTAVAF